MKKLLLVVAVCLTASAFAQKSNVSAFRKHNSNISFGYGIENVRKVFLDKVVDIPEYKIRSTFFFTCIYEYLFLKRFSVGVSGSYSRVNGKAEKYQLSDQITSLSLLVRAGYHFWTRRKLDPYFGGGIGLNNSKYKNLDTHTVVPSGINKKAPNYLDFSAQLGLKYIPLKHFGIYTEVGYVGGAIVHVGITGKF